MANRICNWCFKIDQNNENLYRYCSQECAANHESLRELLRKRGKMKDKAMIKLGFKAISKEQQEKNRNRLIRRA